MLSSAGAHLLGVPVGGRLALEEGRLRRDLAAGAGEGDHVGAAEGPRRAANDDVFAALQVSTRGVACWLRKLRSGVVLSEFFDGDGAGDYGQVGQI